ncbi:MAG: hypothetical protein MJK12_15980 [Colwellia sp.]|nr:hypothetical protein [Colwellia sp.]
MTTELQNETEPLLVDDLTEKELEYKPKQLTIEEWSSYLQNASERRRNNLESAAELAIIINNRNKYRASGIYREKLDRSYLQNDSYEVRKAKAEQLNGCQFKPARAYKSKRWGDAIPHYIEGHRADSCGPCDGQVARIRQNLSIFGMTWMAQLISVFGVLIYLFSAEWLLTAVFLLLLLVVLPQFRKKFQHLDFFQFNRHTGLVKTPHCLFRRSFYIPHEDLTYYCGETIRGARLGGSMGAGQVRVTQVPKRFYLFTPSFNLFIGGISKEHWLDLIAFMDTTKPVARDIHESIEEYFTKDSNAIGNGPFPEVMKPYLDADDKQINRQEVW